MAADTLNRNAIDALLTTLGVMEASELPLDRALKKITNRVTKGGQNAPTPADDDQKAVLQHLGLYRDAKDAAGVAEKPAKKGGKKETAPAADATTAPEKADDSPRSYKLAGVEGKSEDRIESLKPSVAAHRNKHRTDGRKWEETDAKPAAATSSAPKKGKAPTGLTPQQKQKAAEDAKAAGGSGKPAPKTKAAKGPAAAGAPKEKKESTGPKASDIFRTYLEKITAGKELRKAEVISECMEKGVKATTIASYIVWAKREEQGTPNHANPWGVVIEEYKTDKGAKMLKLAAKSKQPKTSAKK